MKRDEFPDSVLVKRFELDGILVRERKILAVTTQRDWRGHKFRVRSRDGNIDMWLSLYDKDVTWE